jgi:hypothetical protein
LVGREVGECVGAGDGNGDGTTDMLGTRLGVWVGKLVADGTGEGLDEGSGVGSNSQTPVRMESKTAVGQLAAQSEAWKREQLKWQSAKQAYLKMEEIRSGVSVSG